jgi:hypothetical protein
MMVGALVLPPGMMGMIDASGPVRAVGFQQQNLDGGILA